MVGIPAVRQPSRSSSSSDGGEHSACPRWCQQTVPANSESIPAGIGENLEGGSQRKATVEGLFLWVTALLVLSLVPFSRRRRGKKARLFTPLAPVSPSHSVRPLFNWNENPPLVHQWSDGSSRALSGSQTSLRLSAFHQDLIGAIMRRTWDTLSINLVHHDFILMLHRINLPSRLVSRFHSLCPDRAAFVGH